MLFNHIFHLLITIFLNKIHYIKKINQYINYYKYQIILKQYIKIIIYFLKIL